MLFILKKIMKKENLLLFIFYLKKITKMKI